MNIGDKVRIVPEIGQIVKIATIQELKGDEVVTTTKVYVSYQDGVKTHASDELEIAN